MKTAGAAGDNLTLHEKKIPDIDYFSAYTPVTPIREAQCVRTVGKAPLLLMSPSPSCAYTPSSAQKEENTRVLLTRFLNLWLD